MRRKVFVLGAGASHGDDLVWENPFPSQPPRAPLANGFFRRDLIDSVNSAGERRIGMPVTARSPALFEYIAERWALKPDRLGLGGWQELNIEEVFTSLAIDSEFFSEGSDRQAWSQLNLNALLTYIRQILGVCTAGGYGSFTRQLAQSLEPEDAVINFNYDLLADFELLNKPQYSNFCRTFTGRSLSVLSGDGPVYSRGYYLKLHGSLNWYVCTNRRCLRANQIDVEGSGGMIPNREALGKVLSFSVRGLDWSVCECCESRRMPFLVPPLLNKAIMGHPFTRSLWGKAFSNVVAATDLIVIGFSFQPTDFYAAWLFRNAVQRSCHVWIVNPLNDPQHPDHGDFMRRMNGVFRHGIFNNRYCLFSQLPDLLAELNRVAGREE